jgi:hypothetical protein
MRINDTEWLGKNHINTTMNNDEKFNNVLFVVERNFQTSFFKKKDNKIRMNK